MNSPDRAALAAFAGAVMIGGGNFVAVKFSNEELDPLFGAALRFGSAAILLLLLTFLRRLKLPRRRAALGASLYGLLGFGFAYGLLYFALVGLSAGTTSVITASVPLVTLVLAVAHGQERFSLRGLLGGLLAVAGIAVLSAGSIGGDLRPIYLIAALVGVVAIAESSVIVKGFPTSHPLTTNAIGMSTGAIFLVVASLAFHETWTLPQTGGTWAAVVYLATIGSIGLFALFLFVIGRWTASATVYALTLMPVVAVTLGAILAGEEVTLDLVVGGALVLSAVYIGALQGLGPPPTTEVPEPLAVSPARAPDQRD